MAIEITMPRLSDTMESGTVLKWKVSVGDEICAGDIIADIETDKATMEMQSFDDGKVVKILVNEGDQVNIGTPIALIGEESDAEHEFDLDDSNNEKHVEVQEVSLNTSKNDNSLEDLNATILKDEKNSYGIKISPLAKRIASDNNLNLETIMGTGPAGRIIKRDVLKVLNTKNETESSTVVPKDLITSSSNSLAQTMNPVLTLPGDKIEPVSNMRKTIARRLVQSKQSIPHYQVTITFEMENLIDLRKEINSDLSQKDIKISVNDFIVRACALSMEKHPLFNSSWGGDHIIHHSEVNVGVAVSLPEERGGGLVVATIRHANHKSLRQISAETKSLANKAKTVGLNQEEMDGSTFTLSNLGMFGVDNFTAIINPPNSAILAVGSAIEKPVVREGKIVIGTEMSATLSLDHRVIDGAMAALYLNTLKHQIEQPMSLVV